MDSTQVAGIVAVPLIVGLIQAAKNIGLPSNWAALGALILGVLLVFGAWATGNAPGSDAYQAVLNGIALGLSASGLYSAGHAVTREQTGPTSYDGNAKPYAPDQTGPTSYDGG